MPDRHTDALQSLTNDQIITLAIEFERQRYALQMEIGRREIGWAVDEAASQYFQIGRLPSFSSAPITKTVMVSKEELDEFD